MLADAGSALTDAAREEVDPAGRLLRARERVGVAPDWRPRWRALLLLLLLVLVLVLVLLDTRCGRRSLSSAPRVVGPAAEEDADDEDAAVEDEEEEEVDAAAALVRGSGKAGAA